MYKTRKVLSVVLAGATVAAAFAATAVVNAVYENFDPTGATYGVIGDFSTWATDVPLTDDDGDGVYSAQVTATPDATSGKCEYKVRANGGWDYSWGAADSSGVTANSQTNCAFTEDQYNTEVTVYFDTRGNVDNWTVGTEDPLSSDPSSSEPASSEPASSEPESSEPESSIPTGEYGVEREAAIAQLGEENLVNYYFFDNSETKWNVVGAYWWTPAENATWPGAEAIQIEGTDIWAIQYDPETTTIIFNNLVSDTDYSIDNPKAQTSDVTVPGAGAMIYVPDMATEEVTEDGAVKKYSGNWVTFEGEVVTPPESSEPVAESSVDSNSSTPNDNAPTNPSDGKPGNGVATGDSAPIAVIAIFAAAALTAVILTKKKVSSK